MQNEYVFSYTRSMSFDKQPEDQFHEDMTRKVRLVSSDREGYFIDVANQLDLQFAIRATSVELRWKRKLLGGYRIRPV